MDRPSTLIMTGDVMLGRAVDESLKLLGPTHPWGDLRVLLNQADLAIVNLECVIARGGQPWSRWPKTYHFRADPFAVQALQCGGIDCVTLANNHVFDYEEEALLEMLDLLEQAGIAFAGAGCDIAGGAAAGDPRGPRTARRNHRLHRQRTGLGRTVPCAGDQLHPDRARRTSHGPDPAEHCARTSRGG